MVSIPFDQGNVFRLLKKQMKSLLLSVSIPFDQGNVFRLSLLLVLSQLVLRLNPFRSGQCLSTICEQTYRILKE